MGDKTNGYAADCLEFEGTGNAVQHYIDGDEFKDPETRRLWNNAALALNELECYIRKETGRDF